MWRLQLGAGAALFLGLPVLNVFTTHSHLVTRCCRGVDRGR
jgi:hypothetical protein